MGGAYHGWYLSTSVPEIIFNKVNGELLELTLKGSLKEIMDRTIGGDKNACGTTNLSISPPVIMIPLAILLGPVLLTICGLLIRSLVLGMDQRQQMVATAEDAEMDAPNSVFGRLTWNARTWGRS